MGGLVGKTRLASFGRELKPTASYLMQTEVHVYALAMAASLLLSFMPFLIVMISFCHDVLRWRAAEEAIYFALRDYFPDVVGEFIETNLRRTRYLRGSFSITSMLLLLFGANGIFEPLEVALNRAWGVRNRSYLRNQILSLGLIFACGTLALISTTLAALNQQYLGNWRFGGTAALLGFKFVAVQASILILFLIYWLLPNAKIPPARILPVAVVVGVALEALKYVMLLVWPWMREKLRREYTPFHYSVSILLLSFLASLVVLAGAEWSARRTTAAAQES